MSKKLKQLIETHKHLCMLYTSELLIDHSPASIIVTDLYNKIKKLQEEQIVHNLE